MTNKRFTLIELIVSMGIFAIIMLSLMYFFTSAQQLWTTSTTDTKVMEKARNIFSLIENDLFHATASDAVGYEIPFYIDRRTGYPTFVSSVADPSPYDSDPCSRLCEVSYKTGNDKDKGTSFMRRTVQSGHVEAGDGSTLNSAWDFQGVKNGKMRVVDPSTGLYKRTEGEPLPEPSVSSRWYSTAGTDEKYYEICKGLSKVKDEMLLFTFWGPDPDDAGKIKEMTDEHYNYLPYYVDVELTLFSTDIGYSNQNKRTFQKRIYLNR